MNQIIFDGSLLAALPVALLAGLAYRKKLPGGSVLFYIVVASLIMPSIIVSLGIGLSFRLLDPRASTVLMDYILTKDANSKVIDRGPYEMHAAAAGAPTTAGAVLAVNPEPVRFVSVNLDTDNAPQGYVMVRNRVYPVRFF